LDKTERRYKQLPIEAKESYKWIKSAVSSQPHFEAGGATQVTYIGDREADIYEEWFDVPQLGAQLLVRVGQDRTLVGTDEKLSVFVAHQPVQGNYAVVVPEDKRLKRQAREAFMSVRYGRVSIGRPKRLSGDGYPASVPLFVVDAQEVSPPTGVEPLHWCLLTTHSVETLEQALQILQWYRWRWRIEQLFAILKQPGLDLEATQLESGQAIQSLCVLALSAAIRVLQLVEGRNDATQPAAVVFSPDQQQCLVQIAPTLQGRTRKQQNPHPPLSLAWATWCIARLGGWTGYSSQRPPGIATILRGLQQFDSFFTGWSFNRDVYTR
ncbi:IS4 family transposase, partial [Leptolyngbya sp. AN03gr2]|uniref:IS4 family transposase n=1 Tax=unclassified Leptolyngbya TaxID=2650499 RepID=UPI003D320F97